MTTHITTNFSTEVNDMINDHNAKIMDLIESYEFRSKVADGAKELGIPADLWNNDTQFRMACYALAANQLI